jgi:hypothetical protein
MAWVTYSVSHCLGYLPWNKRRNLDSYHFDNGIIRQGFVQLHSGTMVAMARFSTIITGRSLTTSAAMPLVTSSADTQRKRSFNHKFSSNNLMAWHG